MVVVDREERHVPIGAGGFEKSIPGERRPGLADVRMSAVVHMISLKPTLPGFTTVIPRGSRTSRGTCE